MSLLLVGGHTDASLWSQTLFNLYRIKPEGAGQGRLHRLLQILINGFCLLDSAGGFVPRPALREEKSVCMAEDGGEAVEGYEVLENEELCMKHEELCMFCLEEGEPLCSQCWTVEREAHQCCSIQEDILDCKVRHKHLDVNPNGPKF